MNKRKVKKIKGVLGFIFAIGTLFILGLCYGTCSSLGEL